MVLALSAVLATAGATWPQPPDLPPGTRIVRAYFDDPLVAAKAVISLDALESEYEKGYIVLLATDDDIEAARRAGMRVVEDEDHAAVALPSEAPTAVVEGTIAGFPCYRTVEGTYARARELVDAHPDLASWRWAGRSWKKERRSSDGYVLHVLRLTNSATSSRKPVLFITGALHAREYTTAELVLRFAEYLVDSYDTDADVRWLLDHQEVHLMLQANPDGRKRAEQGVLWRKNHNTNHCAGSVPGVDLNRNFAFGWDHPGGSSDNSCSQIYRGPGPASEPETRAVAKYMARLFPDARGPADSDAAHPRTSGVYLDIHSHGRLILWPWGHEYGLAPNGTALQTFGRKLAFFNDYLPIQGVGLYPATGTTFDQSYGELGVASFTYELGTTFFQNCRDFEGSILEPNLESLLYAFKVARTPYVTPAGPDVLDLTLDRGAAAPGVAAGSFVTLSATFDDTRYQHDHGLEPTQDIARAEYYVDVPHWKTRAKSHRISAADGAFDSGSEQGIATIDTSDLAAGRHTVFVRGQDADGNWGAISAIFLFLASAQPPTEDPPAEDPEVEASFEAASYEVPEGAGVKIVVRLSADPERDVTIPLVRTHRGGATDSDYSGVPESVTFESGMTEREFVFMAEDDDEEDAGETIVIGFGSLPDRVNGDGEATVSILDDDTALRAAFEVRGAECNDDLCRARTGESVHFVDTSTGQAELRRWNFGDGVGESGLDAPNYAWSEPGFYEVSLWVSDGKIESSVSRTFLVEAVEPRGTCAASAETRCLQDSRYAVEVEWRKPNGETGAGRVVHVGTNDSGVFSFFSPNNWEILINVLDGCAMNGHVWVYAASTTDLGYVVRVTDTVTETVQEYRNEPGVPASAITDVTAFPGGCRP